MKVFLGIANKKLFLKEVWPNKFNHFKVVMLFFQRNRDDSREVKSGRDKEEIAITWSIFIT